MVNVNGDLTKFNNLRTYDSNGRKWKELIKLLRTDPKAKKILKGKSFDLRLIVVTRTAQNEKYIGKDYNPLTEDLFMDVENKMINNKNITYDLNKQAKTFAELFNVKLHDYVIDNFKANSCYLNTIIDSYKEGLDKLKPNGKRMYKELTYELLCEIIELPLRDQDIGLCIRKSLKFFEKFRLGLDVINVFEEVLLSYRPDNINTSITPRVLRILVHNNHTYKLDNDARYKLSKKVQRVIKWNEVDDIEVSNRYYIRKPITDEMEIHFIESLNDCVNKIKYTSQKNVRFITNNDLTDILFEMVNQKYIPSVNFACSRIISLGFKVGHVNAYIENSDITRHNNSNT